MARRLGRMAVQCILGDGVSRRRGGGWGQLDPLKPEGLMSVKLAFLLLRMELMEHSTPKAHSSHS